MSKFWAELKIYPVGLRRPRCAKNAPRARFLYAPRPGGFESLLLRVIEMRPKIKKPHCWGLYHLMAEEEGFEPS